MKPTLTLLFLIVFVYDTLAQGSSDYYRPPLPSPIGTKSIGSKPYNAESLLKTFGDVRVLNRWYVGANGFIRTDKNKLSNSFDGLISTQSPASAGWSASVGWVSSENWTIEVEYARSAIHNVLLINGDNPLSYKFSNDKNSLVLRGKRRLLFGKSLSSIRRSAFWIGGGVGMIPNTGKQKDYWEFSGYRSLGRRLAIDTLFITSDTRTSSHITGALEASAEYIIKVSKVIDLSFYGRKQWGLGNSLTTNLAYYINHQQTETAKITGDGSGWSFGVSLRYVMHLGYDFAKLNSHRSKAEEQDPNL